MLVLRFYIPRNLRMRGPWLQSRHSSSSSSSSTGDSSSSTSSSSDEDVVLPKQSTPPVAAPNKNDGASLKLNELLQTMIMEDISRSTSAKAEKLVLSQPKQKKRERTEMPKSLERAAKDVASTLGGDEQRTKADLLEQLALASDSAPDDILTPTPKATTDSQIKPTKLPISLSELIAGMKIDRSKPAKSGHEVSRAQQVRRVLGQKFSPDKGHSVSTMLRPSRPKREAASRAGLNSAEPLGIFTSYVKRPADTSASSPMAKELDTWDVLTDQELKLSATHPPANIFEEMILWTNQGKLWQFPINNEQGNEVEVDVDFSEHVFLERYIEDWCPKKGPLRHFMELVCVGLSKNPYITAEVKREHLEWYKAYFAAKQTILQETGVVA